MQFSSLSFYWFLARIKMVKLPAIHFDQLLFAKLKIQNLIKTYPKIERNETEVYQFGISVTFDPRKKTRNNLFAQFEIRIFEQICEDFL